MFKKTSKSKQKSCRLANYDRIYLNKNNEDTKMLKIEHVAPISELFRIEHTIFIKSRSGI